MPDLNYRHALLVVALAGAATVALVTNLPNSEDEDANILRIYHIDVEQADATLLVSPSGRTLLIDSGKNGHGDQIKAVMDQAGVTQIDHFVCTHYHEDHFGGIDDLVEELRVTIGNALNQKESLELRIAATAALGSICNTSDSACIDLLWDAFKDTSQVMQEAVKIALENIQE